MNFTGQDLLDEIARVASPEAAKRLAETRGGTCVFVSRNPKQNHMLAKLVGLEAAVAISKLVGAGRFLVPMRGYRGVTRTIRERRELIRHLTAAGASIREIALRAEVSERTVEKERQRMRRFGAEGRDR